MVQHHPAACRPGRNRTLVSLLLLAMTASCGSPEAGTRDPGLQDQSAPARPEIPWSPRRYEVARAEGSIRLDGVPDDEAWTAAPWTEDFVDIVGPSRPDPWLRTRAKLLWDDEALWIAAELEEPNVWGTLTDRDAVIYLDDDFEVFLDPDGDTHQYYELEINALGTEWDLLLVRPYRDGGPAIHAWDIPGLRTAVHVDGTVNDPTDTDVGWSVEIAIPWGPIAEATSVEVPPKPGDRWRANFSRVDWPVETTGGRIVKSVDPATGKAGPEDNWVWSPQGLVAMHYPEMWGIVRFLDSGEIPSGSPWNEDASERAGWELRRVYYAQHEYRARTGRYASSPDELELELPPSDLGIPWPPRLGVTPNGFEAWLPLDDGRTARIDQEGRVRVTP